VRLTIKKRFKRRSVKRKYSKKKEKPKNKLPKLRRKRLLNLRICPQPSNTQQFQRKNWFKKRLCRIWKKILRTQMKTIKFRLINYQQNWNPQEKLPLNMNS